MTKKNQEKICNEFIQQLAGLCMKFSEKYNTELNSRILIEMLGYTISGLYFGTKKENHHLILPDIITVAKSCEETACLMKKKLGLEL